MKCVVCAAFFDEYVIYDLDVGEKAASYICRDCFTKKTAIWDAQHLVTHNIRFEDDKVIIQLIPIGVKYQNNEVK